MHGILVNLVSFKTGTITYVVLCVVDKYLKCDPVMNLIGIIISLSTL